MILSKQNIFIICFLIVGILNHLEAQDSISILKKQFKEINNSDPVKAKEISYQILNMVNPEDTDAWWDAQKLLSHAYYVNSEWDSLKTWIHNAIPYYEETENHFMRAACYRNLAAMGEKQHEPDSSLFYLDKCFEVLAMHPDTTVLGDAYLSQGYAYDTKGYFELSLQSYYKALDIFGKIGSRNRRGYTAQNIGITLEIIGRDDEAIELLEESLVYFYDAENLRTASKSLNAIAYILRRTGKHQESILKHRESIALAKKTKRPDVLMNNYISMAKNYLKLKMPDSTNLYLGLADQKAKEINRKSKIGEIIRLRAELSLQQNKVSEAREFVTAAEAFIVPRSSPTSEADQYYDMSKLYNAIGQYQPAYVMLKKGDRMMDSVFTQNKIKQVEELHIIHQTKEKDAEIVILNKNVEINNIKTKALLGGLGLVGVSSLSVIFGLAQKRRKDQLAFQAKQELEIAKRKIAERELEFKQKELVAKALQLARKNEFLHKLESEVVSLQSTVDYTINQTSSRISRMIQHDSDNDSEWEQFSKEFSSLHQDLLDRLTDRFGRFTTSEIRLFSLMKMNLSSKDIANILRISEGGIKKARYRLRKKMNLESDVNLQSFIMSF